MSTNGIDLTQNVPLPAGVEAYEPEWHHSPGGETHYRRFATKKFATMTRADEIAYVDAAIDVYCPRHLGLTGTLA